MDIGTNPIDPLCPGCESDELSLLKTDSEATVFLCVDCGKIFSIKSVDE
jgi:hypothetical protein